MFSQKPNVFSYVLKVFFKEPKKIFQNPARRDFRFASLQNQEAFKCAYGAVAFPFQAFSHGLTFSASHTFFKEYG